MQLPEGEGVLTSGVACVACRRVLAETPVYWARVARYTPAYHSSISGGRKQVRLRNTRPTTTRISKRSLPTSTSASFKRSSINT